MFLCVLFVSNVRSLFPNTESLDLGFELNPGCFELFTIVELEG